MTEISSMFKTLFWSVYQKIRTGSTGAISFDITSNCNLRCKHCCFFRGKTFRDMNTQEWKKVFAHYSSQGFKRAWLTGGEPALKPEIIKLADNFFPVLTIVSNGTIKIDKDFRHRIFISLDGNEKTHDRIRGKGSFKKILKNYKDDKRVVFRMTITKLNYKEISQLVRIAKEANVEGIAFILYSKEKNDKSYLWLNKNEMTEVKTIILKEKSKHKNFVFITEKMINSIINKDFKERCILRRSLSFYSNGEQKKKCSIENVDCNECMCSLAALHHVFKKDFRTFLLALKFCG